MSLYVDIEKRLGAFRLQSKFEVADETLALLGASGCGKSVTLKCIAGIMTPDRGRIVLNGRVLFDSEKRTDLTPQQRRVGYLFQQYALFPNMTVEQNILCGIRAGSRSEKRALAAEKLRMFRLEGLEKKYPAQLSGGQQQRVALARILCSEPQAILLDEPFSALDSYLKWNLELELSDLLAGFRGPILWVSHELGGSGTPFRILRIIPDAGHAILLLLAIIVLCFAVWLLWPHSFAEVTGIPAEYPDLNMAAIVTAARFENGSPSFDIWNLQYCSAGSTEYEAVLSVLSSASYRQDLRNLLPGGLTSVSSDKYYDSRSVNLMFAWGRFEDECCSLTFSGSQVVVAGPNNRGFQVYHSVDPELLDRLIAEVQTYGVKN